MPMWLSAAFVAVPLAVWQLEARIQSRELELVHQYRALTEEYGRGEGGRSVTVLAGWRHTDIEVATGGLHNPKLPGGAWTARLTRLAVMMHTDLACDLLMTDPRSEEGQWHLRTAERLLQFAELEERDHTFRRQWYVTATSAYYVIAGPLEARALLQRARIRLAHYPDILIASGITEELIATLDPEHSFVVTPQRLNEVRTTRVRYLQDARGFLRKALEAAPLDERARLHLGRVSALLNDRGAKDLLLPLTESRDPATRYLACLFLGAGEEEQRHYEEAVRWYALARKYVPHARAAAVAVSEGLGHLGRIDDAWRILDAHLRDNAAGSTRADPWVAYPVELPTSLPGLWDSLRAEARR